MSTIDDDDGVGREEFEEVASHLSAEAEAERQTALESELSLQAWIMTQPALRQMAVFENIAQFAPALLQFLRAMFGLAT